MYSKKIFYDYKKYNTKFKQKNCLNYTINLQKTPGFFHLSGGILYFTQKLHQNPSVNAGCYREFILMYEKKRTLKSSFTSILIYYLITSNISLDSTTLSEILKALKAFSIDSSVFLPLVWI